MIFATVGTQLPFDRLLEALDAWAALTPQAQILAQTGRSKGRFAHLTCQPFMDQKAYQSAMSQAKIIVAHAGMGSILSAAELGKPIVVLPRLCAHGEHRNDHQIATARKMQALANVHVLQSTEDLGPTLERLMSDAQVQDNALISDTASDTLLEALTAFIQGAPVPETMAPSA